MEDFNILWPILLSAVSAIIGGYIVHRFSLRQDKVFRKREFVLKHLVQSFELLENYIREPDPKKIEQAVTYIQLLGNSAQIKIAEIIIENLVTNSEADITPLVEQLRKDLRSELNLEPIDRPFRFLFFKPDKK